MIQDRPKPIFSESPVAALARDADCSGGFRNDRLFHGLLGALVAGLLAWGIASIAGCEEAVFCGGAARVAGFVTGNPVARVGAGWLIGAPVPVVVTTACSGVAFFVMVAVLAGWHVGQRGGRSPGWACLTAALVGPAVLLVNGFRIVAVAQLHRWVLPQLPEAHGPFLHMLTGVAVFLPALVLANLILEKHGRSKTVS